VEDFYLFVTGGIGVLLICAYVMMASVFNFRDKTTHRYIRVIIIGVIAYFTSGAFSTLLWAVTYLYGFYVVIICMIGYIYGKMGKTADHLGINAGSIFNFIIGYIAADKIIDFFKKR